MQTSHVRSNLERVMLINNFVVEPRAILPQLRVSNQGYVSVHPLLTFKGFMTSKGKIPSSGSPTHDIATILSEHIIQQVYRTTWIDFYEWEQRHAIETLRSLERPFEPLKLPVIRQTPDSPETDESKQEDRDENYFTVFDCCYDADPNGTWPPVTTSTLTLQTLEVTNVLDPYPAYEVCTPVNRNILVGDDSEYMPFLPFSDDPTFDHLAHIPEYRYFEWQVPNRDPDCEWNFVCYLRLRLMMVLVEVILGRTAYRLRTDHHLRVDSIQDIGCLPSSVLKSMNALSNRPLRRYVREVFCSTS